MSGGISVLSLHLESTGRRPADEDECSNTEGSTADPSDSDASQDRHPDAETHRAGVDTLKSGCSKSGWSQKRGGLHAVVAAVALIAGLLSPAAAQSAHRVRRESSANRKARIARTVEETYGHRWEAAGGGGYMRFRSGQYLQQNNEVTFWASTMYSLNPRLGIVGEVRGAYGNAKIGNTIFNLPNPKVSEYSFMAGPSYRLLAKERYAVSAFVEGGMGLGKFAGDSKGLSAADIGVWTGDYSAAGSIGVNLDYNFYPNLAARVTPTYLFTNFGGSVQHSKGVNVGLVYRFGRR